jgi:hypothetical protein
MKQALELAEQYLSNLGSSINLSYSMQLRDLKIEYISLCPIREKANQFVKKYRKLVYDNNKKTEKDKVAPFFAFMDQCLANHDPI